jgi:flagellar motor switch protein FliN/FliY
MANDPSSQPADQPQGKPAPQAPSSAEISQGEIEALLNAQASSPSSSKPADALLGQGEIEAMFSRMAPGGNAPAASATASNPLAQNSADDGDINPADIELLLHQAERALASIDNPSSEKPPGARPFSLQEFSGAIPSQEGTTLELLRDVELDLKIELGRTNMYLEDVLRLRKGAVVPLDKLAGDPVDIYVNGRLIARGEVLVLNDNFCVRIAELISGESVVTG